MHLSAGDGACGHDLTVSPRLIRVCPVPIGHLVVQISAWDWTLVLQFLEFSRTSSLISPS